MIDLVTLLIFAVLFIGLVRSDGLNTISAPVPRETVVAEQPYTIKWHAGSPGPVKIDLHDADSTFYNLVGSTTNNGSYTLSIPYTFGGKDNYYLNICDLKVQNECTSNGRFAIGPAQSSSSAVAMTSSPGSTPTSSMSNSPASTTTNPTGSTSAQITGASASSTSPPPKSPGLSAGVIAGIGIGCAFGGMAFILVGAWILLWRPRQRQRAVSEYKINELPPETRGQGRSELAGWSTFKGESVFYGRDGRGNRTAGVHQVSELGS